MEKQGEEITLDKEVWGKTSFTKDAKNKSLCEYPTIICSKFQDKNKKADDVTSGPILKSSHQIGFLNMVGIFKCSAFRNIIDRYII